MSCHLRPGTINIEARYIQGTTYRTYLLILLLSQVYQDLASGMLNIQKAEDSSSIVCDSNVLKATLDEPGIMRGSSRHTPISSTIILSKPEGPKELLTTFAMACVARTE